jgi:predicted outer membrane repeat protein
MSYERIIVGVAAVFVCAGAGVCFGATITVGTHGPVDYSTIQEAIDAAVDGDEVVVSDGTYTGVGNRDIGFLGKAITVRSENGPENCIIDCEGTEEEPHRGFNFISNEDPNSVLDGFQIINGYGPLEDPDGNGYFESMGGAVYCQFSSPTLINCVFIGSSAQDGGGLCCYDSIMNIFNCTFIDNDGLVGGGCNLYYSNPRVENCLFLENKGSSGAGMYWGRSNPIINGCAFNGNIAEQNGGGLCGGFGGENCEIIDCIFNDNQALFGGGMRIGGTTTLTNCTFNRNIAEKRGGAIEYWNEGFVTVNGCIFNENSAGSGGSITLSQATFATITDCVFSENISKTVGGAIIFLESIGTINKCRFFCNEAGSYGGGVYCYSLGILETTNSVFIGNRAGYHGGAFNCKANCSVNVTNCTLTGNSAEISGGGVWCDESTVNISNTILWDNEPAELWVSETMVVENSCIEGGWRGNNNIEADPCFFDTESSNQSEWDLRLRPESFCIDKGTNTPIGSLTENDIENKPRLVDGDGDGFAIVDMGAYEMPLLAEPAIKVSRNKIRFWAYEGGNSPDEQSFVLLNSGGGILNWQVAEDSEWLTIIPSSGTIANEEFEVLLLTDIDSLSEGIYESDLIITSPEAVNSPQVISVLIQIISPDEDLWIPYEYPTIQSAIDTAEHGDTIILADGIYRGDGNRDISFLGKSITVRSESGPENCIIDCQGAEDEPHRGFLFVNDEGAESILEGVTLRNAYTSAWGAAIYCSDSSPTIRNCNLSRNIVWGVSNTGGSALYCRYSSPTITNCIFDGNSSEHQGGAMRFSSSDCLVRETKFKRNESGWGGVLYSYIANPRIEGCFFENNKSLYGGVLFLYQSNPVITESTFVNNQAMGLTGGSGGVMRCTSNSRPIVSKCFFGDNICKRHGGALSFSEGASGILTRCLFDSNESYDDGGAISISNTELLISNCVFSNNYAKLGGGAIWNGQTYIAGDVEVFNCTFSDNTAGGDGGGVYSYGNGATSMRNCVIWGNEPNELYIENSSSINYCDIRGAWEGEGNIDVEPMFVGSYLDDNGTPNPNDDFWVTGDDYHLRWDSPCVDAGDPNFIAEEGEVDIDGEPRVMGYRVDMGADEVGEKQADFTRDGRIDVSDLSVLSGSWDTAQGQANWYVLSDLFEDGVIGLDDLSIFVDDWMWIADWHQ